MRGQKNEANDAPTAPDWRHLPINLKGCREDSSYELLISSIQQQYAFLLMNISGRVALISSWTYIEPNSVSFVNYSRPVLVQLSAKPFAGGSWAALAEIFFFDRE